MNEVGALAAAEESRKFAENASLKSMAVKVDITDEANVKDMVQTVVKRFGRIDYSVSSAGVNYSPRMFPIFSMISCWGISRSAISVAP